MILHIRDGEFRMDADVIECAKNLTIIQFKKIIKLAVRCADLTGVADEMYAWLVCNQHKMKKAEINRFRKMINIVKEYENV